MYEIEFSRKSAKELTGIGQKDAMQIMSKIRELASDPYGKSLDVSKMRGVDNLYRLRVRNYRVIYEISNNKLLITVIKIGTRGGIYG